MDSGDYWSVIRPEETGAPFASPENFLYRRSKLLGRALGRLSSLQRVLDFTSALFGEITEGDIGRHGVLLPQ